MSTAIPATRRLAGTALLAVPLILSGCLGRVQLLITAAPHSNSDRPVYVLAADVDAKTFDGETYDSIAAKVETNDDSVRWVQQVQPGAQSRAYIKQVKKGLGLYVLYAEPQDKQWRVWVAHPPHKYELEIK